MRKPWALLLLLVLCWFSGHGALLFAQEEEEDEEENGGIFLETDWDRYIPDLYARGDQIFIISVGTIFPAVFYNNREKIEHNFSPPVGGNGSLAYTYFFSSNFFVGGELGFKFNYTLAKNVLFFIPIGLRAGWHFVVRRFELPLYITFGGVPQRYIDLTYFGFFLKGGGGVFYRFSPEWSFGVNTDWNWYPQRPLKDDRTRDRERNVDGHIVGLTLSARYHF